VDATNSGGSATYYTTFAHEPPRLKWKFEVPVYHDVPDPKEEDPYNIRGLQDRKPYPTPRTFICALESAEQVGSEYKNSPLSNQYHGHFRVAKSDWFQEVLAETGAPPGIQHSLGIVEEGTTTENVQDRQIRRNRVRQRRIRMDSLMKPWREATSVPQAFADSTADMREEATKEKSKNIRGNDGPYTRIDPDIPLGRRK